VRARWVFVFFEKEKLENNFFLDMINVLPSRPIRWDSTAKAQTGIA
jgi:hypothetical protein